MEQNDKIWQLAYRDFRALSFIYTIIFLLMVIFFINNPPGIMTVVFGGIVGIISALMVWLMILFKKHDKKAVTIGFPLTIISLLLVIMQFVLNNSGLQSILTIIVQGYLVYRVNTVRVMLSKMDTQAQANILPSQL